MHKKSIRNAYKKSVILWMAHQILSEVWKPQGFTERENPQSNHYTYVCDSILLMYHTVDISKNWIKI
jgi:hypothetical protein